MLLSRSYQLKQQRIEYHSPEKGVKQTVERVVGQFEMVHLKHRFGHLPSILHLFREAYAKIGATYWRGRLCGKISFPGSALWPRTGWCS
jgi:hypothetical protein